MYYFLISLLFFSGLSFLYFGIKKLRKGLYLHHNGSRVNARIVGFEKGKVRDDYGNYTNYPIVEFKDGTKVVRKTVGSGGKMLYNAIPIVYLKRKSDYIVSRDEKPFLFVLPSVLLFSGLVLLIIAYRLFASSSL